MKPILILLMTLPAMTGFSQITSIWRGMTPGHERNWNCPSNWSNNRIPDEFTDVIIPVDISINYRYPVIKSSATEINSLHIWPGATLTVKEGEMWILDAERSDYLRNQIIGKGKVRLQYEPPFSSEEIIHVSID